MSARSILAALGALSLAACGVFQSPVARTVDGVTTEGRFIEPEAYALYAMAALREARGEWREALAFYERARELDGSGPEISTRIAAVACQLRENNLANQAFTEAEQADASYGPLWFELARCQRLRGDLRSAHAAAREAMRLDPQREDASLLAADVAERLGDRAEAFRLLDALATRSPESLAVQRALRQAAQRAVDRARLERAERAIERLTARGAELPRSLGEQRALSALKAGDAAAALREAERLLQVDPSNGDAWIIALAGADLQQDQATFDQLLQSAQAPARPASPEALSTLAAVLARRVGSQAAALVTDVR